MRKLENGTIIKLNDRSFRIEKCEGAGGSCVAYRVSFKESGDITHFGILKEYCPAFLENSNNIRNSDNSLIVADEYKSMFENGANRFKNTYKTINNYLYQNLSATNFHTVQLGLFEGNNTLYTLTSCDYGEVWENVEDKSLSSLLKIILAVTKAVEMYHNAGFLHLDIKPKNIFILDSVSEVVKLFDFDSLTSIDDLKNPSGCTIPNPGEYYVPQLNQGDIRHIDVTTDIFEIGAVLYKRLFGRYPQNNDMLFDSKYDFENVRLLNGFGSKVKYELELLLKNTLQVSPKKRYQSTSLLKEQLSKLIGLVDGKQIYISNLPKWPTSKYVVGRQNELKELKDRLDNNNFVFIRATGGTGKSELAKMFAQKYKNYYHTVQFCKYSDSLKALVANLSVDGINDNEYKSVNALANEKNKILHSSDNKTLLIVDNFNVTYDEYLREFLPVDSNNFKVIFTTRCIPAADYCADNVMNLDTLDKDFALELFYLHSNLEKSQENDDDIISILENTEYNTLTLVLIAKAIRQNACSLNGAKEKIENSQLDDINSKIFYEYDFSSFDAENYNKIFNHINTIFNFEKLSSAKKRIMLNLSIVAHIGIEKDEFINECNSPEINESEINELYNLGWIEKEAEGSNELIMLHPIISDLFATKSNIEKDESYKNLATSIIERTHTDSFENINLLNTKLAYMVHLNKRIKDETSFLNIDTKINLGMIYVNLYLPKKAKNLFVQANKMIDTSFKYKPRFAQTFYGLGLVEKEFGNIDIAIDYFNASVYYCENTFNCQYALKLTALCKIGDCYKQKHLFNDAYNSYLKAYDYTQNDTKNDKTKQLIFSSNENFKKDLSSYIGDICDNLIEVCNELAMENEVQKFKKIKALNKTYNDIDEMKSDFLIQNMINLINSGDIKGGANKLGQMLNIIREELGEESPQYKSIYADGVSLLAFANKNDGVVSLNKIFETVDFIEQTYGESSEKLASFLSLAAFFITEIGEVDTAYSFVEKAKAIYENNNFNNAYEYNFALAVDIYISTFKGDYKNAEKILNSIDTSLFKSKSDKQLLAKLISVALIHFDCLSECISLNEDVAKLSNEDTNTDKINFVQSYASIANCYLESGDTEKAFDFIFSAKAKFDTIDSDFIKDDFSFFVYSTLSKCYYDDGNINMALASIEDYFASCNLDNKGFTSKSNYACALNLKLYYLRKALYFDELKNIAFENEEFIESCETVAQIKGELLVSLAIACVYCGKNKSAVSYFEKYENLIYPQLDYYYLSYIEALLAFIDIFSYKGYYYKKYFYKAEDIINTYSLQISIYNASLLNYNAIHYARCEDYATAKQKFKNALYILEQIELKESELYNQIEDNIDYVDKKVSESLIEQLALSMREDYNESEENKNE